MLTIFKDRLIHIEWTIFKGTSNVREDFTRALVKCFLIGPREKYLVEATAKDGTLFINLPQGLEEGAYSIEVIYVKNQGNLIPRKEPLSPSNTPDLRRHPYPPFTPHDARFNDRCIMRSRRDCLFAITEYENEEEGVPTASSGEVTLRFNTSTASYGYDGLSAYEIAVMRGDFDGSEGDWIVWTNKQILDKVSGLINYVHLEWKGSPYLTRISVPTAMRKKGLIVNYELPDGNVCSEKNIEGISEDERWGLDSSWTSVYDINLTGDVSVSPEGNWIINGEDTGVKAVGPQGNPGSTIIPRFNAENDTVEYSWDNVTWHEMFSLNEIRPTVSVGKVVSLENGENARVENTGTANNVIFDFYIPEGKTGQAPLLRWYNNRIEQSIDKGKTWSAVSDKFDNHLYIKGYVSSSSSLPKNALIGDIYGVGPTYDSSDEERTKPYYQLYVNTVSSWALNYTITTTYLSDEELPSVADKNVIVLVKKSTDSYLVYKYSNSSWVLLANLAEIYVESDDIVNRGDNVYALVQSEIENQYLLYKRNVSWVNFGTYNSIQAGIVQETGNSENTVMSQKSVTKEVTILNANTGVSEYSLFSESEDYAEGESVLYSDGFIYTFTKDHSAGAWTTTDVTRSSIRKWIDNKITELENKSEKKSFLTNYIIKSSILNDVTSSISGEGVNGASVNIDDDIYTINIPKLENGGGSYISANYNEDFVNILKEKSNGNPIRFIAEVFVNEQYSIEYILEKLNFIIRDQENNGITTIGSIYHFEKVNSTRAILYADVERLEENITKLKFILQFAGSGFSDNSNDINVSFCNIYIFNLLNGIAQKEVQQIGLSKFLPNAYKLNDYNFDSINSVYKIKESIPFFLVELSGAHKEYNSNNYFYSIIDTIYGKSIFYVNLFNNTTGEGIIKTGLKEGDKICYKFCIREDKSNEYDISEFSRNAYWGILTSDNKNVILKYLYQNTESFVANIIKYKEDTLYNYYQYYGYITIGSEYMEYENAGNVNRIRFAFMSAAQKSIKKSLNYYVYDIEVGASSSTYNTKSNLGIEKINKKIEEIEKNIGVPYNSTIIDAFLNCKVYEKEDANFYFSSVDKIGYEVPLGVNESGNYIDVILKYGTLAKLSNSNLQIDTYFAFTGDEQNQFSVEILNEELEKLDDGTWWYDFNNGWIRCNYSIEKFISRENIVLRLKATSEISNGFKCYFDHVIINGLETKSDVNSRLVALETNTKPTLLTSPSGKKFELIVSDDGQLSTRSYSYSKILHLGHSFAAHAPNESLGWTPTEAWGMAAETKAQDYIHTLHRIMSENGNSAEISAIISLSDFERNHNSSNYDYTKWSYINDYDFDCIIVRLGENVTDFTNFGNHLIDLIENYIAKGKYYHLFISSNFAKNNDTYNDVSSEANIELKKVSDYFGTKLVMINKNDQSDKSENTYNAWNPNDNLPPKSDGTLWDKNDVTGGVVYGHPGNHGMEMIANEYWSVIKEYFGFVE